MKVRLISYTPEPEKLIATAARVCYSNKADIETIQKDFSDEEISSFIEQLIESGHHTVLEHPVFSFAIEGISRICSHQLVRHRIGIAISQRSQRYCLEDAYDFIEPDEFFKRLEKDADDEQEGEFATEVCNAIMTYKSLVENGISKENARYVLPGAMPTRMIVTMNARELLHFFALRCCLRAQPEMQELATSMLEEVKKVAPVLFKKAGPSCIQLGYCPEGKRSCGFRPTMAQLLETWYNRSYHGKEENLDTPQNL